MIKKALLSLGIAALTMAGVRPANDAWAHTNTISYSKISVEERSIRYTLSVSSSDLSEAVRIDSNGDKLIARNEIEEHKDAIFAYVSQKITVINNGVGCLPSLQGFRMSETLHKGRLHVRSLQIAMIYQSEDEIKDLKIECTVLSDIDLRHQNFARINLGDDVRKHVFNAANDYKLDLARKGTSLLVQIYEFLKLGVEHIFTGYDHILFLVGLLILAKTLGNLVKIVSSFTVAHSITLILATLEVVSLPSRLVEAGIALSITYIAAENLYYFYFRSFPFAEDSSKRWIITFFFGLVHGFGFSGILREMGLPKEGLILSLLSFNVGVEAGQLAIVSILFPALYYASRYRWYETVAIIGASAVIFCFGVFWFVERAVL